MSENKLVPKLRFGGFDKYWNKDKLQNYCNIKHGFAFKGEFFSDTPTKEIVITPGNFKIGGGFQKEKLKYYRGQIPEDFILKTNDLIITMTDLSKKGDTLGYSALIPDDENIYLHNQRIGLVVSINHQKIIKEFIYWLLRTDKYHHYIISKYTGSSVKHTSPKTILNYEFYLPSINEQIKISSYLDKIDEKIQLLENKIKSYVNFKKYLMQQIFAQKLRFKDENNNFYENWEELHLKDIISLNGGYAFKSELFKDEGVPIIRISNISSNNSVILDDLVYYDKLEKDSDFIIKKGELIIAMSGATTGKVAVYDFEHESYINQRVGLFKKTSSKLYYPFLVQYTLSDSFKRELQKTLVAGAQPNISKKEIESFNINLPQYEEQKKIADLLSNLDLKINTIKNQNLEISMFKKSLLQQMFV